MRMRSPSIVGVLLCLCLLMLVMALAQWLPDRQSHAARGEVYTGTVTGIGPSPALSWRQFTLRLEGATSDEELRHDAEALRTGGQGALLAEVRGRRLGSFQIAGDPASDVRVARLLETQQGLRLTLLFESGPRAFASRAGARAEDYPFAYVELYLGGEGKFSGTLVPAARVGYAAGEAALEDFGAYPARLAGARRP